MNDLAEREWFQRDPVTGNFVPATPPAQFSTAELTRMAEEITRLREALERAREAISMLNKDALGYAAPPFVHDPERHQWPIRDELLAEIDKALTTPNHACPSCGGLNTSCPDGCGRDPKTGELNSTRLTVGNEDGKARWSF